MNKSSSITVATAKAFYMNNGNFPTIESIKEHCLPWFNRAEKQFDIAWKSDNDNKINFATAILEDALKFKMAYHQIKAEKLKVTITKNKNGTLTAIWN